MGRTGALRSLSRVPGEEKELRESATGDAGTAGSAGGLEQGFYERGGVEVL